MKILNNNENNVEIILDENDILDISTLKRNKEHIIVKCLNSSIHVDELTIKQIKKKSIEENEIKKMESILNKKRP